MKKIGIIGDRDTYRRNHNYYAAVEACGGCTIPLTVSGGSFDINSLDGLVIPGGEDINPALYHEENTASINIDEALDDFETNVLARAVKAKIPVLGICRGHQLINVFFGGNLIQHVKNLKKHVWVDKNTDSVHDTMATEESFMYEIYKSTVIPVNSAHHQAIDRLGNGLRTELVSDDGIVEAIRHETLPIFGVQFHPERMCLLNSRDDTVDGLKIFEYFMRYVKSDT